MLTAPSDLDEGALGAALAGGWGLSIAAMSYRPVGWGSHHWEVAAGSGGRWFVTVDEVANKRLSEGESLDDGFRRLRASLRAAADLRNAGLEFVVAPVPAASGEPVARMGERFAVAVYPFTDGESFTWDEVSPEWRRGMLGMVAAVHGAPVRAPAEEFAVPFREGLEAACAGDGLADSGPYARPAAALVQGHAAGIARLLGRYDELVAIARREPGRVVLTHGEPHPGNTMLTADGWRLIDWDTAAVAPPERDLWDLDPGDGSILDAYAAATGVTPLPELLELYRLGWDVKDIAYDLARFRRPHGETADDVKTWSGLSSLVGRVCSLGETLARMAHIELGNDNPGIRALLAYRPETAGPLSQLAEVLLRADNTLSRGERELIAAYVSKLNECVYCASSHSATAAAQLPGGTDQVERTLADLGSAPVSGKLRALLEIAGLVQVSGQMVTAEAVAKARAEGATDVEVHDTVLIAAAFCMFNRYVDGLGTPIPADPGQYAASSRFLVEHGYLDAR